MTDTTNPLAGRAMLYRKIAAVTAAVARIPKNGRNEFHRYDYATESDITDGLRALLNDNGLAFLPPSVLSWERDTTADNPKQGPRTRVQVQFALGCADTGEMYTTVLWGEGQDASDKGFYKAYTGAVKYFLMKTFLIATGDDPERDDTPPQRSQAREAQYQQPQKTVPVTPRQNNTDTNNGAGAAEARRKFYERWSVPAGTNWPMVAAFLGSSAPEPTTVDGWREVWRLTKLAADALEAEAARQAEYDAIEAAS